MPEPRLDYDLRLAARQDRFSSIPEMVAQRVFVRAALALRPGERVIEIGCGNGWLACEMAAEVGGSGHVVGADISADMVAMANVLVERAGHINVEIVSADATDLPFPDGSFDAAAVVQCFCLVPDVEGAIAELFRVLRPGGRAVILDTDWNTLIWNSADPVLMDRMMSLYTAVYSHPYLPPLLPALLSATGFCLLETAQFPIINRHLEPESFSGHQIGFTKAVGEALVPARTFDEWIRSIETTRNTSYFFQLVRSLFRVAKPCRRQAHSGL
jgi:ubiquinone/menaquinone biosynthesis C-methylase UbiE